jgi:SAM-dependent methyltransferase/uncharacterized protein YbaR (Trm112 family)
MRDPADEARARTEARTSSWIEDSMRTHLAARSHEERVHGDDGGVRVDRQRFGMLQRKLKLFRWLDRLRFETFLDAASGWEHYPYLVRQRYGAETYYSDLVHSLTLPTDGPRFGKRDHAVTLNLARLPFPDGAFDVVLCSEVFEHLVHPIESVSELLRITRRCLVLTTLEGLAPSRWHRALAHHRVDVRVPHVERNFLLADELRALFGPAAHLEPLQFPSLMPASPFEPSAEQDARYAAITDRAALAEALLRAGPPTAAGAPAMGVLAVCPVGDTRLDAPAPVSDAAIVDWVLREEAEVERELGSVLAAVAEVHRRPEILAALDGDRRRAIVPALRELVCCPDCRSPLAEDGGGLRCVRCEARFPGEYGVPILYPSERAPDVTLDEALDRLCGGDEGRKATLRAVHARLRRNEAPPGVVRRGLWALERRLGLGSAPHD